MINPRKTSEAYTTIQAAMVEDGLEPGSYSYTWFCNIKMNCLDEITRSQPAPENEYAGHSRLSTEEIYDLATKIANRLMSQLFQITTTYE